MRIYLRPAPALYAVVAVLALGAALLSPLGADSTSAANGIIISEVAPWSSGNTPVGTLEADWFEVTNISGVPVNIAGWRVDDSSASFGTSFPLVGITTIAPSESVIFIETTDPAVKAAAFRTLWFGASPPAGLQIGSYSGAGLGLSTGGDAVNLYNAAGVLQANVAFGVSPAGPFPTFHNAIGLDNATIIELNAAGVGGAFVAANDPNEVGSPGIRGTQVPLPTTIRINEVESNAGSGPDWVELINNGVTQVDLGGFVLRDNNNANSFTLPTGAASQIPAGGRIVLQQLVGGSGQFAFALDATDAVRLLSPSGTTVLDSYTWLEHSATTFGRCADGTGAFISTLAPTRGVANSCPVYTVWPGGAQVQTADVAGTFGENMSGLAFERGRGRTPDVLWAVRNNPETLFRLLWDAPSATWQPDTANGWSAGKQLRYPSGLGRPDSEGVTFTSAGSEAGVFVATERDNGVSGTSRAAILRFDPTATGTELVATNEWLVGATLPTVGANLGLEAITWVPDSYLVEEGLRDEATGRRYDPKQYPNHGRGLFLVGVEASGFVYAFALDLAGNSFTRVATIDSGFPAIVDLQYDRSAAAVWAVCDNMCQGRTALLEIRAGEFRVTERFQRPAGMPDLNNEGFAVAPNSDCVRGQKPVFWTDDGQTDLHAIRSGTLPCGFGGEDGDDDDRDDEEREGRERQPDAD